MLMEILIVAVTTATTCSDGVDAIGKTYVCPEVAVNEAAFYALKSRKIAERPDVPRSTTFRSTARLSHDNSV